MKLVVEAVEIHTVIFLDMTFWQEISKSKC